MASFTALYDACALDPAMLRDTLMRLALTDHFRAKWSEDIHREWMTRLRTKRPDLDPAQRAALQNPTIGPKDFVANLEALRLTRTAEHLRRAIHQI